jgi:hypothetical protein
MKKRLLTILLVILTVCITSICCIACGGNGGEGAPIHTHEFIRKDVSNKYIKTEADCENDGVYYYSCNCGEKGTETFSFGRAEGHEYQDCICKYCDSIKYAEGLIYTPINNNTEYEVTSAGLCTDSIVYIPEMYNGKKVTSIGADAFINRAFIFSIVIPNSVEDIGSSAFNNCDSLTSITFNGTREEWNKITKGSMWIYNVKATFVTCADGTVNI